MLDLDGHLDGAGAMMRHSRTSATQGDEQGPFRRLSPGGTYPAIVQDVGVGALCEPATLGGNTIHQQLGAV